MDPRTVPIPPLFCPFHHGVHERSKELSKDAFAWARGLGFTSELGTVALGNIVGLMFARAKIPDGLQFATRWALLFLLLDDMVELLPHPDAVLDELASLKGEGPMGEGFRSLYEQMQQFPPTWRSRFNRLICKYLLAFKQEAWHRRHGTMPDMLEYRPRRILTSGVLFGCLLIELTHGVVVPRTEALIRKFDSCAASVVGLSNDLFTAEKELAQNEPNNAILLHLKKTGCTLLAALLHAVDRHDREMRFLLGIYKQLRDRGGVFAEYAEAVTDMVAGHHAFALKSLRYTPQMLAVG